LLEHENQLASRFAELRDSRTGPVFFIEHGLAGCEIDDLIAEVRAAATTHAFDSWWWEARKLPLIVAATEIGYRYRGSGTDFWPVLEEELDLDISATARQKVKDLFASAANRFRGAKPPSTPWAEAFHLIAWPITHALVPIEFHRPLALTLANLQLDAAGVDDETLHRAIRAAAVNASARFSTLLHDARLVVAVTKSLLGLETRELCPETTRRLTEELARDSLAQRGVAAARRVQRTTPARRPRSVKESMPPPAVKGKLQLRRRGDILTVEAIFPTIDERLRSELRRALRRRRYAPCLWGTTSRVSSEQLLSGLPFTIKLESVPQPDSSLLPGLDELAIDERLRAILEAFELQVRPPLLFGVGADNEVGRHVQGPTVSAHRKYWVLAASPLAGCAKLADVGPFVCHSLDPTNEGARRTLSDLGYSVRFGVSVSFAGAPALDREVPNPTFLVGDDRVVVQRRSHPDGLLVDFDDEEVRARPDEVVRLVVPKGEHSLRVSSMGADSREYTFRGVIAQAPPPQRVCDIVPRSSDLTVQAFLGGRLAFAVESFAPLDGLPLTVEIEARGRIMNASSALGPLPQVVSSELEPLASLIDDSTRELLLQAPNVALRLQIGNLCARSWRLEHRVRPCWWWVRGPGQQELRSELGELPFGQVALQEPHLPPSADTDPPQDEAKLLAPIESKELQFGSAANFSTLCIAPAGGSLQVPAIRKPRLLRRRKSKNAEAAGVEDLFEAYLRWSLAESATSMAEFRSQQVARELDGWIVEACCGASWQQRERDIPGKSPWEFLVDIANEHGLGRDEYVKLPEIVWREALSDSVAAIRRELPELWTLPQSPSDLGGRDWTSIEDAFEMTYKSLSARYRGRGDVDIAESLAEVDFTADNKPEDWTPVLKRVTAQCNLTELAAMILPTNSAPGLVALDPAVMSTDEICDELDRWAKESRLAFSGGVPTRDTLRAVVALWTDPEFAITLDWRSALDTLIAERSVARAARYMALRSRQASSGGGA
jgi:hypothetical protein